MFLITVAFRHDTLKLQDEGVLISIAEAAIGNMIKNPLTYYKSVEEFIKPMSQLEAGLHFNISTIDTDCQSLKNALIYEETSNTATVVRIRRIANNFVKIDFACESCIPFRVNSQAHQDHFIINNLIGSRKESELLRTII